MAARQSGDRLGLRIRRLHVCASLRILLRNELHVTVCMRRKVTQQIRSPVAATRVGPIVIIACPFYCGGVSPQRLSLKQRISTASLFYTPAGFRAPTRTFASSTIAARRRP